LDFWWHSFRIVFNCCTFKSIAIYCFELEFFLCTCNPCYGNYHFVKFRQSNRISNSLIVIIWFKRQCTCAKMELKLCFSVEIEIFTYAIDIFSFILFCLFSFFPSFILQFKPVSVGFRLIGRASETQKETATKDPGDTQIFLRLRPSGSFTSSVYSIETWDPSLESHPNDFVRLGLELTSLSLTTIYIYYYK